MSNPKGKELDVLIAECFSGDTPCDKWLISRLVKEQRRLFAMVRRQRDDLAKEITLAARVQRHMLPQSVPHLLGYDLAWRMLPAKTVAGDYYDFIELKDGNLALVIADISGKGVPAGFLMPSVKAVFHLEAPHLAESQDVMRSFNRVIHDLTDEAGYVTLFYGNLNPAKRLLQYTNGGHLPGLLFRSRQQEAIWLGKGGLPLGLLPEAEYESETIALDRGDVLALYTDGLTEAENRSGEQFSADRLLRVVSAHHQCGAEQIIETICATVTDFKQAGSLTDDLTLIVLRAE